MYKVNLNEILKSQKNSCNESIEEFICEDGFVWKMILNAMKEACEQSIEICALEAKSYEFPIDIRKEAWTDRDSILRIKKALV